MRTHLPATKERARALRKAMSLPEVLLWRELRKRPNGLKFRRQHPFGHLVLDFYCDTARLGLEIDGEAHSLGDQPAFDAKRDAWLAGHNLTTLRIPAKDVLANLDGVIHHICEIASQATTER